MARNNRYRQMEQMMTLVLIGNGVLFALYLLFALLGIVWLKVILCILTIPISALCLVFLYMTGELLRRRSQWMTIASAAVLFCTIVSLLTGCP